MSIPLVSIAISFFNNQHTLNDAIVSVLNQTFDDWELILLDDGSTDDSLKIAKQFKDVRITLISDKYNKGLVERLNQSVSLATGKYYARMDSDDIMHPERLNQQVQFLEQHPEVDVVDTPMYVMNQSGHLKGIRNSQLTKWSLKLILSGKTLNHATVMGHTEWFKKNPYNPEYIRAEDVELWCRTINQSTFARLNKELYFVREGKINIKNYLRSQSTMRKIFRTYGPLTFNTQQVKALICQSYLKAFIYKLMGALGIQAILTRLRNKKVPVPSLEPAQKDFALATKNPS
jgi:glycosyltransferase involved in cell wall biosynthesis